MQAQSRFVEKQDGVGVLPRGLGKEHDEKGNQPLKPLRPLVEFDLDSELVFDDDLQILAVGCDPEPIGLVALLVRHPHCADFGRQPDAGGV